MANIRLRPGVSYRGFTDRAIILDIDRDRYWQVSRHVAELLDQLARGDGHVLTPTDLAYLQDLSLVETTDGTGPTPAAISLPEPATSAIEVEAPAERFRVSEAIEVAFLAVAARRRIRRRSLRSVIAAVDEWRDSDGRGPRAGAVSLARRFARYRRLVPFAARCLPDTIAFLRFAARRGCFPRLVFGVEAWPFAAHCWAQAEDCVLTDAVHHARSFSPILIL